MSWWMRRRGRASARSERSRSGSVSRKLPPTIQKTSRSPAAACSIISAVVQPGASGTGKPQSPAQRSRVWAGTAGTQPTSAPPCTPEWPRIGTSPEPGRPGRPRARPTLSSALIVSTPWTCCVRPMDQTRTAFGRSMSSCAKASMRSRVVPAPASIASQPRADTFARAASNPVVCAATQASSTPSLSISALSTPVRNARSPPVRTANQSSAMTVPFTALDAIDGIQYRSRPGSR